uniref:Uncharacterized protein n=1 Tax=Trypanosoma congolense (strain IL3000) TaxID=1068625 RepID=G0UN48_TRYCI|nr:hypothetical protein, unlikely [Trypanosoma congolense IL3000]
MHDDFRSVCLFTPTLLFFPPHKLVCSSFIFHHDLHCFPLFFYSLFCVRSSLLHFLLCALINVFCLCFCFRFSPSTQTESTHRSVFITMCTFVYVTHLLPATLLPFIAAIVIVYYHYHY